MTIKHILLFSAIFLSTISNTTPSQARTDIEQARLDEELLCAAMRGNYKRVEQFLNMGANINAKDKENSTTLNLVSIFASPGQSPKKNQQYLKIASLLIERGIDINSQENLLGNTAIHNAAFHCNFSLVELLYKNGAKLNIKNKQGETPFESISRSMSYGGTDYEISQGLKIMDILELENLRWYDYR